MCTQTHTHTHRAHSSMEFARSFVHLQQILVFASILSTLNEIFSNIQSILSSFQQQ